MSRERQQRARPGRLPRRPVDRIEDLVLWILIALGLLTAVLATTVAMRRYDEGMHQVNLQMRERTPVQAVLLEPAPQMLVMDVGGQAVRLDPAPVPIRYVAPDGTERRATARVSGPRPAGDVVPVWVDRQGAMISAPVSGIDAVMSAAVGAIAVLAVGAVVLVGIGAGVRIATHRFTMLRWAREWEQVEPQWSRGSH
jgi:hypothetical protein